MCGCVNCGNPDGINDTAVTHSEATGAVKGTSVPQPPPFAQVGVSPTGADSQAIADAVAVERSTLEDERAELAADGGTPGDDEEDEDCDADALDEVTSLDAP